MQFPFIRNQLTGATRAQRMLEAGNLKVTVRSKVTGEHITVEFASRRINEGSGKRWIPVHPMDASHIFIQVPRPDSGWADKIGTYYPSSGDFRAGNKADPARVWAVAAALRWLLGDGHPEAEFQESNSCGRCGRELTDPVSIERGIGPECYSKITGSKHQTKVTI